MGRSAAGAQQAFTEAVNNPQVAACAPEPAECSLNTKSLGPVFKSKNLAMVSRVQQHMEQSCLTLAWRP